MTLSLFLFMFGILFFINEYIVNMMFMPDVEAPSDFEYDIVFQTVGYVERIDGKYHPVMINVVKEGNILASNGVLNNKTAAYYSRSLDTVHILEQYLGTIFFVDGRCFNALWHELKHAEWDGLNIDFFDEHEWMRVKYICY